MLTREILISSDHLEDRAALLEDGEIVEIFIARGERMVGSIYKGKVVNVLPGMQAAFVDIGLEKNTFLCLDDAIPSYIHDELGEDSRRNRGRVSSIEKILKPRQETVVQMVKEPMGTKGGRITTNITLPGRYLVLLPMGKNYVGLSRKVEKQEERDRLREIVAKLKPPNMGVIIRTAAEFKEESLLKQDLESLVDLWEKVQKKSEKARAPLLIHQDLGLIDRAMRDLLNEDVQKVLVDSRPVFEKVEEFARGVNPKLPNRIYFYEGAVPLFELYGVEAEVEKLLRKKVWLPSGGYLIIDQTEALTVIDVNTGKYVGSSHSLDDTILDTNLEAAGEIARQIRLRDLSGIIIVDFIDMERREDRHKLLSRLEDRLKRDRVRTTIFGITNLGLVEMTRKRSGKNVDRLLREECFYCGGHGRVWSPESVGIRLEREIRRSAHAESAVGLLVSAHPQVALNLAGWEGERLASLEESTGKEIFLRVDPNLHLEKFRLHWDRPEVIRGKLEFLAENQELEVVVQDAHPLNFQSGIAFVKGQIVEVQDAGNRVGEELQVKVVSVSRFYTMAKKER